jgi:hypothetical protein
MHVVTVKILCNSTFYAGDVALTASSGFATEGNPVAEPDHTWDHYEKQGRPHLGRLWDRSGSLSPVPVDAGSIENGSF